MLSIFLYFYTDSITDILHSYPKNNHVRTGSKCSTNKKRRSVVSCPKCCTDAGRHHRLEFLFLVILRHLAVSRIIDCPDAHEGSLCHVISGVKKKGGVDWLSWATFRKPESGIELIRRAPKIRGELRRKVIMTCQDENSKTWRPGFLLIQDLVFRKLLTLSSVKTGVNPSDIGTKALGRERFHRLRSMLGMGTELSETSSLGKWYSGVDDRHK